MARIDVEIENRLGEDDDSTELRDAREAQIEPVPRTKRATSVGNQP